MGIYRYRWLRRDGNRNIITYQAVKAALDRHERVLSLSAVKRERRRQRVRDLMIAGVWVVGALGLVGVVGFIFF